jgi:hypothetical protein
VVKYSFGQIFAIRNISISAHSWVRPENEPLSWELVTDHWQSSFLFCRSWNSDDASSISVIMGRKCSESICGAMRAIVSSNWISFTGVKLFPSISATTVKEHWILFFELLSYTWFKKAIAFAAFFVLFSLRRLDLFWWRKSSEWVHRAFHQSILGIQTRHFMAISSRTRAFEQSDFISAVAPSILTFTTEQDLMYLWSVKWISTMRDKPMWLRSSSSYLKNPVSRNKSFLSKTGVPMVS